MIDDLGELARAGAAMADAIGGEDTDAIDAAARNLSLAVARLHPQRLDRRLTPAIVALADTLNEAATRVERLTAVTRRRRALVQTLGGAATSRWDRRA